MDYLQVRAEYTRQKWRSTRLRAKEGDLVKLVKGEWFLEFNGEPHSIPKSPPYAEYIKLNAHTVNSCRDCIDSIIMRSPC